MAFVSALLQTSPFSLAVTETLSPFEKVPSSIPVAKRVITRKVEDSFATGMLDGTFAKGDTVNVTADENGLSWNKSEQKDSE